MVATLTTKVLIVPAISIVLGKTLTAAVTGIFTGTYGAPTYGQYVLGAAVRAGLGHLSPDQFQWLLPPFTEAYKTWCASNNITPDIVKLESAPGTAHGFWVGDKSTAKYHMVYIHGGGWVMPGSANQLNMLTKMIKWSNNKLAVFCVAYTLSPEGQYPLALGQCVEGLRYVLEKPGRSPSNVLIGGDSAGGNLTLAVLGHLGNPHPDKDIVKPLKLSEPLFGAVIMSPWISSDDKRYRSFKTYQNRDNFPMSSARSWSAHYKGGKSVPDDNYIWPAHAPASWWTRDLCQKMYATVGEQEIIVDAVIDWAQKYEEGTGKEKGKLDFVVGKKEIHIAPLLDPKSEEELLEPSSEHTQEGGLMRWVQRVLTQ